MTELNKDDNNDNPTIRQHHLCVRYQRGETAQLRTWNKIEHRLSASTSGVTHILTTCSSTWDDKCGQSFFENYFCRCCEPTTRMSLALSTIISFCRFIHSTKFHRISSTLNVYNKQFERAKFYMNKFKKSNCCPFYIANSCYHCGVMRSIKQMNKFRNAEELKHFNLIIVSLFWQGGVFGNNSERCGKLTEMK
ncbi:hypothetical protein T02_10958 [Trichinella nativa]|uniref:Uncharacterized protein n=1 Tax=Trichinella nativa TaxID=6335 RepID=A0A0V1KSX1_9BILA|nr:hypothetical protein T02_10958 [Trichinella nativa]